MGGKIDICGVYFDYLDMDGAFKKALSFLDGEKAKAVYTPNSEIVQECLDNPSLFPVVNSAELIVADGVGIIKASKILKTPLPCKIAGVELGEKILAYAAENAKSIYFLGGKPGVAKEAELKMKEKYPGLIIAGLHDGYFNKQGEENEAVIADINNSAADILFVCLGAPAQEKWICENREKLTSPRLCLGLGGSIDIYAGTVKRAPGIFVKSGLEWFYRFLRQPSRFARMTKLPRFVISAYKYKRRKNKA